MLTVFTNATAETMGNDEVRQGIHDEPNSRGSLPQLSGQVRPPIPVLVQRGRKRTTHAYALQVHVLSTSGHATSVHLPRETREPNPIEEPSYNRRIHRETIR